MVLPNPTQLLGGALVFLRIGAMLFALPIFGDAPTPIKARVFLALALTLGLYPTLPTGWAPNMTADVVVVISYIFRELLIGLTIGFIGRVAFDGLMTAAAVVSVQMGFSTASLFLPDYGEKMDGFSALHRMLVMMIFLSLGFHQIFLQAIVDCLHLIPGGAAHLDGPVVTVVIKMTSGIFAIAIQLAAPVLVALLFTMAALGLIARAVPNMNAFLMSFPASFIVGLIVYIATLPFFPNWMRLHFTGVHEQIFSALRLMAQAPSP